MNRDYLTRFACQTLVAATLLSGCGTHSPDISERGRLICRQESRQAGSPAQIGKGYTECLKTIDSRLADEDVAASQSTKQSSSQETGKAASATERYTHCWYNKEKIQQAYSDQFGLQGTAISLTNTYGRDDSRAKEATAKQQEAYRRLEKLIPEHMRNGLPLVPDSVEIFSRCDRSDFYKE